MRVSSVDLQDHSDAEQLLAPSNVDLQALRLYAHDAAHFSTAGNLPDLQFVQNHAGQPDVAMFDFTCMYRAENASLIRERRGRKLLMALVGDCLVEVELVPSIKTPLRTFSSVNLTSVIEITVILDQNESFALCFLQPFWPLGTGIARGFLASFDTAWMVRSWALGVPHLKVLAER